MLAKQVEVLIPHPAGPNRLRTVLGALRSQTLAPGVCVVDNGSSDGSAAVAREEFPEIRYLRLDRNLGFGAALNRGVRTSSAELVIFLNNDAVPNVRFVGEIVDAHARTGAEMIAACLLQPGGEIDSLGVEVDGCLNAYDAARGEPYGDPTHELMDPPLGPTGGAAGFSRQAFLSVGGFDEGFFAYLEDVDLAIRMRMAGMRCGLAYGGYAWHVHSSTLGSGSSTKNRLLAKSRGYLLWKYRSNLSRRSYAAALATDAIVYAGKLVFDRNAASLRGRLDNVKERSGRVRPGRDPGFGSLPFVHPTPREALGRRLARRR